MSRLKPITQEYVIKPRMPPKKAPPPLPWTLLQEYVNAGMMGAAGSLDWCRHAPREVRLYCAACDTMKNIAYFPRRPRCAGADWYMQRIVGDDLSPVALAQIEAEMRASVAVAMDWQCLDCREIQDRQLQNRRRAAVLSRPCGACAHPLAENMPGPPYIGDLATWIRNTRHRHPHGRKCQRCLQCMPPPWSVALRTACRDWRDLQHGDLAAKALYRVIANLGCTTLYRCPWKGGLDRIALFLGTNPH